MSKWNPLFKNIERAYDVNPETGCWEWKRSIISTGYGHLTVNNKQVLAHRFVYEKYKGKIPEGYTLDHLCRNPRCVNPDHLEAVLHAENCRRGKRARLTVSDRCTIFELRKQGIGVRQIARQIGFYHSTVSSVLRGKAWA